jgi:2-polyprenyl-3-methyl-5-hydroxy-6-metoxy-1,4-benzoquinol methylase
MSVAQSKKAKQAMTKAEQTSATYDRVFSEGGYEGIYDLPYWRSSYYPLFKGVLREVIRRDAKSVLEVGCGTGGFAHLLFERTAINYRGFDFSEVAVRKAIARTGRANAFYVGDATSTATYQGQNADCIVCTEVLEHIDQDLEAIANWKPGTYCVCSVPNFDADTHVRFFLSDADVRTRYGSLIDIEKIRRIRQPEVSDLSFASRLRALRWNRYRPRRLIAILGMASFNSNGGWFLFSGTRKRS